jgi:hypothetical protein
MKIVNRIFYVDVTKVLDTEVQEYLGTVAQTLLQKEKSEYSRVKQLKKEGLWEDFFIPVKNGVDSKEPLVKIELLSIEV